MKKIIMLLLAALCLTGCNYQLIDTNYVFNKIHIYENNHCYKINSWTDYEGEQLQVYIEGYGIVLISSFNCLLIKDKCPICGK